MSSIDTYSEKFPAFSESQLEDLRRLIGKQRQLFPHFSEEALEISCALAIKALAGVRCYSADDIIKMHSKQRARCAHTKAIHQNIAIDMAILVKLCGYKRNSAAFILSYAQWNEYTPGTILDFYKRHLPSEYKSRDYRVLSALVNENNGGLSAFYNLLSSRLDRLPQLYKKLPEQDAKRLELWLEGLKIPAV